MNGSYSILNHVIKNCYSKQLPLFFTILFDILKNVKETDVLEKDERNVSYAPFAFFFLIISGIQKIFAIYQTF